MSGIILLNSSKWSEVLSYCSLRTKNMHHTYEKNVRNWVTLLREQFRDGSRECCC